MGAFTTNIGRGKLTRDASIENLTYTDSVNGNEIPTRFRWHVRGTSEGK